MPPAYSARCPEWLICLTACSRERWISLLQHWTAALSPIVSNRISSGRFGLVLQLH
jgi:hypothetical protein